MEFEEQSEQSTEKKDDSLVIKKRLFKSIALSGVILCGIGATFYLKDNFSLSHFLIGMVSGIACAALIFILSYCLLCYMEILQAKTLYKVHVLGAKAHMEAESYLAHARLIKEFYPGENS